MKIVARRSSGSLYAVGFGIALSFICRDARAQLGCDDTGSVPNEVLVKFRSADGAQKTAANALVGGQVVKEFSGDPNLFLVRVPEGSNLDAVLATYNGNKSVVEFAEKNRIYCPVDTYPNDPLLGYEWGLIGSAGIGAPRAWDYSVGSFGVSVADNDTGADLGHQDLVGNIGAAVSFIGGSAQDTVGHGTHTAGTIAASGNNGVGVSGVMWNANLLILKICNSQGCYLDAAVSAIDYGIQNGAWLSSNSWGGGGYSQALRDAIARADAAGLLFIAAAGNNNSNNDVTPFYPCNYGAGGLQNVICVASIDSSGARSSFSNYGRNTVHLAAPGRDVASTYPGNQYVYMSGTSMATPHVSGVAGLIWSLNPSLGAYDVKNLILNNVRGSSLPVISGGALDAGAALAATPPF